jgi:predicted Rossmann fold flavoprotein
VAEGGFLFTHRGYSGPAVLDVSHHAVLSARAGGHQPILARWTPDDAERWDEVLRSSASGTVAPLLRRALPTRLADRLLEEAGIDPDRALSQLRRDERLRLVELLTRYPLPWTGDEGYRKAEVTGGGVALGQVNPRTLESRVAPGLFLCGEILDAFGPIGGYNFAWAWATGRAAGSGAAAMVTGPSHPA